MTRFPHDQFAKQYLEELLTSIGEVRVGLEVLGESRQVDVWFAPNDSPLDTPSSEPNALGILGRMAQTPCLLEPYRNPPTPTEIRSCLLKLFLVQADDQRKARREGERSDEVTLPFLWVLATSASEPLVQGFGGQVNETEWMAGIYLLPQWLRTAIVAINQLPEIPETLWLRILGKGETQRRAVAELVALPKESPFRISSLELLLSWRLTLETSQDLDEDDQEVFMNLSSAYEATLEQGIQQGRQEAVENLLKARFGEVDEMLAARLPAILKLSPEEYMPLLVQLSREELLARFPGEGGDD
ncbi:flagellar assembly protein H [Kovacikia minuta CCNUW1]|uniref:flagellar assembly protein H n=1 Tax=Kovacikia minuta TaxID=2931930 RepID=UPI001CD0362A|nr:flagellar assembly protein H [Kovacikia minuta]UBF28815.1 flagellar assembly protein H [Kovacikia minuta CCNUW1]